MSEATWLEKLRVLLKSTGLANIDAFLGCADISAYRDLGEAIKVEIEKGSNSHWTTKD